MAHDHQHGHMAADGRRLKLAIVVIALGLVAQLIGALVSGSLALLADSGHMFSRPPPPPDPPAGGRPTGTGAPRCSPRP
jgi:hypothetical protein